MTREGRTGRGGKRLNDRNGGVGRAGRTRFSGRTPPKPPIRERLARAGLEIPLQLARRLPALNRNVGFRGHGQARLGRIHLPPLMRRYTSRKIVRRTDVHVSVGEFEKTYPMVGSRLSSLLMELRETLPRLIALGCQSTMWPATRSRPAFAEAKLQLRAGRRRRVADGVGFEPTRGC